MNSIVSHLKNRLGYVLLTGEELGLIDLNEGTIKVDNKKAEEILEKFMNPQEENHNILRYILSKIPEGILRRSRPLSH